MVYTVRCYKCGSNSVRLILGGRSILHARCQACGDNLLDEVLRYEAECEMQDAQDVPDGADEEVVEEAAG